MKSVPNGKFSFVAAKAYAHNLNKKGADALI